MRQVFTISSLLIITTILFIGWYHPSFLWVLVFILPLVVIGFYDMIQKRHSVLRNYPLVGHFRYLFEVISPELHQYFVESDIDGRPFSRLQRNYVYKHAKQELQSHPFGTELDAYQPGYYWMAHSMYPKNELSTPPRVRFGGKDCPRPYEASIFNISAMSFGALGKNAVMALNKGAKLGGFYQNTGEGGLAEYHLRNGGDLVFQIGTAYFGCRDENGNFSEKYFREIAAHENVKMIEVKLSQGAKPGLGGLLPASKNSVEIAAIRKIRPHTMVHSPPAHTAFDDAEGLLRFLGRIRELSGGKPVGFKLCIGSRKEFIKICEAMIETDLLPDFITVDGGEGGTGAAPIEFSDNVGMPLDNGLTFVVDTLRGYDLKKDIRVIASGKVITGFDIIRHLAIGADTINCARGMMFSLGCIQALQCDANTCPVGIATQMPGLQKALVVEDKAVRVANYHRETVKSALAMLTATGLDKITDINRSYIYKRVDHQTTRTLEELYPTVEMGAYLKGAHQEHGEPDRHKPSKRPAEERNNAQDIRQYPSRGTDDHQRSKNENL